MRKIILSTALVAVFFSGAGVASAATTTEAIIAQLRAQIADLNAKLVTLQTAQHAVRSSQDTVAGTLKLLSALKEGMSGEEVTLLQTTLAGDPSIYPEGKITGYYGKLTKEAVKRFQKRHGMKVVHGSVDAETLKEINRLLSDSPISKEDDDDQDDNRGRDPEGKRICLRLTPGLLRAPGQEKRGDGDHKGKWEWDRVNLTRCKNTHENGTTTPPVVPPASDTVAPSISTITYSGITMNTATLSWTTSESARVKLFVSTTTPVGTTSPSWADNSLLLTHGTNLTGLTPLTTYYVITSAEDASGNRTFGTQSSFITLPVPDTTAPIVSAISAEGVSSTSAMVKWTTNEPAGSRVYYGTTNPLSLLTALNIFVPGVRTAHEVSLTGLSASTTYFVVAESKDASGNTGTSSELSFTTPS